MGATSSKTSTVSEAPRRATSSKTSHQPPPRRSMTSGMGRTSERHVPSSPMMQAGQMMFKKPADDDAQSHASVSTKADFSPIDSQCLSSVDSCSNTSTLSRNSRRVADLDHLEVDSGSSAGAMPTSRPPKLLPPSEGSEALRKRLNFGQFSMIRTVGVGFMGSVRVVKRTDSSDGRPFALKIMKKAEVIKRKQVEHCNSERQLLSQVDHPFIVRLHGTFQDDAHLFMLMEFVNGGELFSAIRTNKRFQNDGAKFYASELILALDYLHCKDIAFRDLKPENVLLDFQGHAKITDFGFAKLVPKRTWTMCGTPEYLAPEIIKLAGHGKCVDWWALGIIIYEMLCGFAPFNGNKPSDIAEKVLHTEPKYPYHITSNAKNLIEKLLVRDPCRRLGAGPQGAKEIKGHPWFNMVDWDMVLHKRYQPPIVPSVNGMSDTSRFDKYPEKEVDVSSPSGVPEDMQKLFKDF